MNRREFLDFMLLGGAALMVPGAATAAIKPLDPMTSKLAGAVYYTKKRPGRWSNYAEQHLPAFTRKGNALQLKTPHEMRGYGHFIVKHMLFDRNFRMIGERSFDPDKDWPVSVYDITGLDTVLYGVSVCNQHDTWLAPLKL